MKIVQIRSVTRDIENTEKEAAIKSVALNQANKPVLKLQQIFLKNVEVDKSNQAGWQSAEK